ncbi:DnaJ domain-containing protein [filamentous cyanobacterium LEGE 11480]|uniref:DnaJ domain-containing protein n=1 Tax=Romeriopsis navalis LEGE 11480 TaxID=2777977 RepID=A0A928Z5I7_9CYAN|nr:J domain-containing protein [Romeriopsis navalis]MBE9031518.1 DnaJ domain-containing protein [Romeriopsis navalis LEGE 11480]
MSQTTFSNDWLELLSDPYAVLGLSLAADDKSAMKHYRNLAKQLHPDRFAQAEPKQQEFAGQLVARLVNPAYGKIKQKRDRAELLAVLRLQVQQLERSGGFSPTSEAARILLQQAPTAAAMFYEQQVAQLAEQQYSSFTQFGNITHQLHELNLVYLQRKLGSAAQPATVQPLAQTRMPDAAPAASPAPRTPAPSAPGAVPPQPAGPQASPSTQPDAVPAPVADTMSAEDAERTIKEGYALRHYERAQQYIEKGAYDRAIEEMKDALRMVSYKSEYHSLLSYAYFLQNLPGMAAVYCRQALKLNPEDLRAQKLAKKMKLESKKAPASKKTATTGQKRRLLSNLFRR